MSETSQKLDKLNSRYEQLLEEQNDVSSEATLARKALEEANAKVEAFEEKLKAIDAEILLCHHAQSCHQRDDQQAIAELVKEFPEAASREALKKRVREKEELKAEISAQLQSAVNGRYAVRGRDTELVWLRYYLEEEQQKIEKSMKELVDES
jgi:hypothetical protein